MASLLVSLVALGGALFLLALNGPCDTNNAIGIFTTVLAMWTQIPRTAKHAAEVINELEEELDELHSQRSGVSTRPLSETETYLSESESA